MNPTRASILTMPDSPIIDVWRLGQGRDDVIGLWAGESDLPTPKAYSDAARRRWPRAIPSTRRTAAFPRCARPSPATTNASAACGSMMNASPPPAPA